MNLNNTIISSYGTAVAVDGALTEDYNLFYNNTNNILLAPGSSVTTYGHSITGLDPRFANPAAGDYHLAAGSAAASKGSVPPAGLTDLDGHLRWNPSSIGAYESWFTVALPAILR